MSFLSKWLEGFSYLLRLPVLRDCTGRHSSLPALDTAEGVLHTHTHNIHTSRFKVLLDRSREGKRMDSFAASSCCFGLAAWIILWLKALGYMFSHQDVWEAEKWKLRKSRETRVRNVGQLVREKKDQRSQLAHWTDTLWGIPCCGGL